MVNFAFQTESAHFPNLDLFFPLNNVPSTFAFEALPRTCFQVRDHVGAKPLVYLMLRATAGCRFLMKTVDFLGGCDCGGKVILVEAKMTGVCSLLTSMQDLGS